IKPAKSETLGPRVTNAGRVDDVRRGAVGRGRAHGGGRGGGGGPGAAQRGGGARGLCPRGGGWRWGGAPRRGGGEGGVCGGGGSKESTSAKAVDSNATSSTVAGEAFGWGAGSSCGDASPVVVVTGGRPWPCRAPPTRTSINTKTRAGAKTTAIALRRWSERDS